MQPDHIYHIHIPYYADSSTFYLSYPYIIILDWIVSFNWMSQLTHYSQIIGKMSKRNISKVVILGDSAVGKTSLLNVFTEEKFVQSYKATVGADFTEQSVIVQGKEVVLEIWDTAGQERFKSLGNAFYRGSDCCMLVYDITSAKSFANIETWIEEFLKNGSPRQPEKFPFVLVGNKVDLQEQREVDAQSVRELLEKHPNVQHCQTSAKNKEGVKEVFERTAKASLSQKTDQIFNAYNVDSTRIKVPPRKPVKKTCC